MLILKKPDKQGIVAVVTFIGVLAISLAVRLWLLPNGFTLDGDEAQAVNLTANNGWLTLFQAVRADSNPPLLYVLLKIWFAAFGSSDTSSKIFGLLISAVIPPLVFALLNKRAGFAAAATAGLLLCWCTPLIYFATRVRGYGLMVLFGAIATVALCDVLAQPNEKRRHWVYAGALSAAVYSHFSSLLLVAAHGMTYLDACLLPYVNRDRLRAGRRIAIVTFLVCAPLIEPFIAGQFGGAQPWRKGTVPVMTLLLLPIYTFTYQTSLSFEAYWSAVAIFWAVYVAGIILIKRLAVRFPDSGFWAMPLLCVILVISEIPIAQKILRPAYLLHFAVPIVVLAVLMAALPLTKWRRAGSLLVVSAAMFSLWIPNIWSVSVDRASSTIPQVFATINADVKRHPAERPFVVVSCEWYAPPAYRYLDRNVPYISYPAAAPATYVKWIGFKHREYNQVNRNRFKYLLQEHLARGEIVYHLFVNSDEDLKPPHFDNDTTSSGLVQKWLLARGVQVASWQEDCEQAAGIRDTVQICKFARKPAESTNNAGDSERSESGKPPD